MAARHDLHAAVFFITAIERHPRSHAGAGLYAQIVLILVERLASGPWRLKVKHRLHRIGFGVQKCGHTRVQPAVNHPLQTEFIPTMHVDHAWEFLQGICILGLNAGKVTGEVALGAQFHIVVAQAIHFFRRKEARHDYIAFLVITLHIRGEIER